MTAITITEVKLQKDYAFMYENFVFSSQHRLFLVLEYLDNQIDTLQFDFVTYKYGYPNDEVSHPLSKYGLGFYGLYKVINSPWITEIVDNNRQHPGHSDTLFEKVEHYIAKFKDVTLEVISRKMTEKQISKVEFLEIINEQFKLVDNNGS